MLFGYPLSTVYLTVLIIIGLCTIIYLFFSDLADGAFDAIPLFDPALILPFISITSAISYILEKFTSMQAVIIFVIGLIGSAILTTLFYYFLLVPLRSSEVSLAYSEQSLEGQVAKVITPIPTNGFGEIVIESVNGMISKRAASLDGTEINYNESVLIIEMKDGTAFVTVYENLFN